MANSKLSGKFFKLPEELLEVLSNIHSSYSGPENVDGYERLNLLLKNKFCTYEQLKRIKHDLENVEDKNSTKYQLPGGDVLLKWVNDTLEYNRNLEKTSNNNKSDMGLNGRTKDLTMKPADTSSRGILTPPEEIFNEEINRIKNLIIY